MYFVTLKASFFSPRGTEHIPFSCSSLHHHSTGWPCKKEIGKIAFSDLQQKLSEVFFAPDLFPWTFRSASSVTMLCIKLAQTTQEHRLWFHGVISISYPSKTWHQLHRHKSALSPLCSTYSWPDLARMQKAEQRNTKSASEALLPTQQVIHQREPVDCTKAGWFYKRPGTKKLIYF